MWMDQKNCGKEGDKMLYKSCQKATFLSRPNRFIAYVEIDGKTEIAHVKNTGRCKELLMEGCEVILEVSSNPARKTKYDLIAVYKGKELINMDSQAPNRAVEEWLKEGGLFSSPKKVKAESVFGNSRFDFYVETENGAHFIEVKGVTLEKDGKVYFPDAPTLRGTKHIKELIEAKKAGYGAWIVFVVQMQNATAFYPNFATDPAFAKALQQAQSEGVKIFAYTTKVTENSIVIDRPIDVVIDSGEVL